MYQAAEYDFWCLQKVECSDLAAEENRQGGISCIICLVSFHTAVLALVESEHVAEADAVCTACVV